jgi:cob(I)alamin adenosyltransferase
MSIVTKGGDQGETSFFGGQRVSKSDPRVEAYGRIDELNSAIGVLASYPKISKETASDLLKIQEACFTMGSELATPATAPESVRSYIPRISEPDVAFLEKCVADMENMVLPQQKFILPGGSQAAALAFWVRTVARGAERAVVGLKDNDVSPFLRQYLNRVSDYFFILGRFLNYQEGREEREWFGGRKK